MILLQYALKFTNRLIKKLIGCTLLLLIISNDIVAQTVYTGNATVEDYIRREQLQGNFNDGHTLILRPIRFNRTDSSGTPLDPLLSNVYSSTTTQINLFPLESIHQYNAAAPYGWNDGAMIPNKGYQTLFSTGFHVEYRGFSLQLKPEFVFAENKTFEVFPYQQFTIGQSDFKSWQSKIDQPERYGTKAYLHLFWGQSHVAYTYKKMQISLSTENLWWGPSFRNSLLMTNNAPGFTHLSLHTIRPFTFWLGSISFQYITGELQNSNVDLNTIYNTTDVFSKKSTDKRYLSGLALCYQPKWVKGLSIGMFRTFMGYEKDIDRLGTSFGKKVDLLFPVFTGFLKNSLNYNEDSLYRDQKFSLFFRYLMPASNFEIYGEYGREDHNGDLRDLLLEPEHSRSYIIGCSKLFQINRKKNILVQFEMTQVETNNTKLVRGQPYWYVHAQVQQGYTNLGQTLGAGVGTGGNSQTLKISWNKSYNSIYVMVERYVHNNDFFYNVYGSYYSSNANIKEDIERHWIDYNLTLGSIVQCSSKMFLGLNATLIKSYNYQWFYESPQDNTKMFGDYKDLWNASCEFYIRYKIF